MARKELIDLNAVMDNIPTIMGLSLTRKGDKWQGGYYLDRTRHPYRRDKLKVWIWNYNIYVAEEGGKALSLQNWLIQYAGVKDYKEALRIMRGNAIPLPYYENIGNTIKENRFVQKDILEEYQQYPLDKCNLFNWMCRLFGENKTREAWIKYRLTSSNTGDVIFWYIDNEGNICHDKRVRYLWNGRRDKTYGGSRRFKTAEGYRSRCLYGSHLIESEDEIINIVESEKTAIACSILFGGIWLACGGKNNLRDTDNRTRLFPDIDAVNEWYDKGNVVEWWENCGYDLDEHADILDMIELKLKNGSLDLENPRKSFNFAI